MVLRGLRAVLVTLTAVLAVSAWPAAGWAAEATVSLRAGGSFTAGGDSESVTITVRHQRQRGGDADDCLPAPRASLAVSLPGLTADQVRIFVYDGKHYRGVGVTDGGNGLVGSAPVSLGRDELCRGRGATLRYRVQFRQGAPGGEAILIGMAYQHGRAQPVGQDSTTREVRGGRPTPSPTPTPTPTATGPVLESAVPTESIDTNALAGGEVAAPQGSGEGGGLFSFATIVIVGGLALVATGGALLVALVLRARRERDDDGRGGPPYPPPGGAAPTMILPRIRD